MRKQIITFILACVLVEVAVYFAGYVILNETPETNLPTSQFASTVSSQLANSGAPSTIGKNYNISSVKYFYNKQWAVISIASLGSSSDNTIMVLKYVNGQYSTVLSPSNQFPGNAASKLPAQVLYYLNSLGVINYRSGA